MNLSRSGPLICSDHSDHSFHGLVPIHEWCPEAPSVLITIIVSICRRLLHASCFILNLMRKSILRNVKSLAQGHITRFEPWLCVSLSARFQIILSNHALWVRYTVDNHRNGIDFSPSGIVLYPLDMQGAPWGTSTLVSIVADPNARILSEFPSPWFKFYWQPLWFFSVITTLTT